tara:strand:- start:1915 stop:2403 length:489 start_codon:yes stop_codon:yes gene_type:complete
MNIYDAAKILGLTGTLNPQDTKTAYHAACKKYHPDINPVGEEMMKIINDAYDALKEYAGEMKSEQTDYGDMLNDALNTISGLPALVIEICGSWVWITGETREHKDMLKEAGFKWAAKKKAWYFRPEEFSSRSKGTKSLEEIRAKYGSQKPHRTNNLIARRSA